MRPQINVDKAKASRFSRMLSGVARYAAAEKSDPFAMSRAMAHISSGIAGVDQRGNDAFYDADEAQEERVTPDGNRYFVTVYRNIVRP